MEKLAKLQGFIQHRIEKNHPMVPSLDHFQGKNRNCSSFARTLSASGRSFFAILATFERRSGLQYSILFKFLLCFQIKGGQHYRSRLLQLPLWFPLVKRTCERLGMQACLPGMHTSLLLPYFLLNSCSSENKKIKIT